MERWICKQGRNRQGLYRILDGSLCLLADEQLLLPPRVHQREEFVVVQMVLHVEDEHDLRILRRIKEAPLPLVEVRAVAVVAQRAHQNAHQPRGLLHVRLTVVGVVQVPLAVLTVTHDTVSRKVGRLRLARQVECMLS